MLINAYFRRRSLEEFALLTESGEAISTEFSPGYEHLLYETADDSLIIGNELGEEIANELGELIEDDVI
jgi:hypothetical protein